MSKDEKRWRAEKGGFYHFVSTGLKTRDEAEAAAEDVRKVFMRHAGELHDFEWALGKLKQGEKVCRNGWNGEPFCIALNCEGYEDGYKYLVGYSLQDEAYGFQYGLKEEDILATDWEIYQGE